MARGSVRLLPWDEGGGEGVRERESVEFCLFVCLFASEGLDCGGGGGRGRLFAGAGRLDPMCGGRYKPYDWPGL